MNQIKMIKASIELSISPPLVYFDTCAYDLFFKDDYQKERKRFLYLMNEKEATFMFSWANIIELVKLQDEQIESICNCLDEINVRPIEFNPQKVIERERTIKNLSTDKYIPIVCEKLVELAEQCIKKKEWSLHFLLLESFKRDSGNEKK